MKMKKEVDKIIDKIGASIVSNYSDMIFQDMEDILNCYIRDIFQILCIKHGADIADDDISLAIDEYFSGMYSHDSEGENDDDFTYDIEVPEYDKEPEQGNVYDKKHKGIIIDLD